MPKNTRFQRWFLKNAPDPYAGEGWGLRRPSPDPIPLGAPALRASIGWPSVPPSTGPQIFPGTEPPPTNILLAAGLNRETDDMRCKIALCIIVHRAVKSVRRRHLRQARSTQPPAACYCSRWPNPNTNTLTNTPTNERITQPTNTTDRNTPCRPGGVIIILCTCTVLLFLGFTQSYLNNKVTLEF